MTNLIFPSPSVIFLQQLVGIKTSLLIPTNMNKAVRLYFILRVTYDDQGITCQGITFQKIIDSMESFSMANWVKNLSIISAGDKPYSSFKNNFEYLSKFLTTRDILFDHELSEENWKDQLTQKYGVASMDTLWDELIGTKMLPIYPFAVENRTLRNDFTSLKQKKWFVSDKGSANGFYYKNPHWQNLLPFAEENQQNIDENIDLFYDDYLSSFFAKFWHNMIEKSYLLFESEYVIKQDHKFQANLEKINNLLRKNWSSNDCQVLEMNYQQNSNLPSTQAIIYPVTFVYIKRAPYLYFIYEEKEAIQWSAIRFDRILSLTPHPWSSPLISDRLKRLKHFNKLPTTVTVRDYLQQDKALGYAFWKPKKWMILQFDRLHYETYILPNSRKNFFISIPPQVDKIFDIIQEKTNKSNRLNPDFPVQLSFNKKELNNLLSNYLKTDKYVLCLAKYYEGDNDIIIRLLSWGKKVRVLLPFDLQTLLYDEISAMLNLYDEE